MVWYGMVILWYGMVWYGTVQYGIVWYSMIGLPAADPGVVEDEEVEGVGGELHPGGDQVVVVGVAPQVRRAGEALPYQTELDPYHVVP